VGGVGGVGVGSEAWEGRAEVGPKLYDSGHENVTCVDISPVVVSWMRARYAAYSELEFAVMDVSAPGEDLEENMFDLVLDKALTDALACGDEHSCVHAAVSNFFTALRPGGKYVVISHAAPSRRLSLLGCARSIPGFDAVSALEPASDRDDDTLASGYSGTPAAPAAAPPVLAWSAVEGKRLPKPSLDGRPTPTSHWMYILTK
jgi:SAM-dependent methyltransferase